MGLPQAGQDFDSGVFVAGTHFRAKADPDAGHKITVIHMAGTPRLLGIAANFRSFLKRTVSDSYLKSLIMNGQHAWRHPSCAA